MAKFLRKTDNPQFTNKNATLDSEEGDETLIELQQEINESRGLAVVKAYNNAKPYQKDEFSSAADFNIYKFISDVSASGVVPGTDSSIWKLSSMAEFLLDKNFIVLTAQELSILQQSSTLQKGRSYFISDPDLISERGYTITVYAEEVGRLSIRASLHSLVPDFQDIGDYTGVVAYKETLGVFTDTKGTLDYDNLAGGPFEVGEIVTGGTSGATAVVVDDADPTLTLRFISGTMVNDEVLTGGTSGATSDVNGVTAFTFNPITGDVVIWDGRHFRKQTDLPTSVEPDLDGTNYQLLDYSVVNGYILDTDKIDINLSKELTGPVSESYDTFIFKRNDKRGNDVFSPLLFQWGNDLTGGNIVQQSGELQCINTLQEVRFNTVVSGVHIANMQTNALRRNVLAGQDTERDDAVEDIESDGQIFIAIPLKISSADILQMNGVRQQLIPAPGPGKIVQLLHPVYEIIFNSIAYSTAVNIHLITDTADQPQYIGTSFLANSVSNIRPFSNGIGLSLTDKVFKENEAVFVFVPVNDPTIGDSDIIVRSAYRIINL